MSDDFGAAERRELLQKVANSCSIIIMERHWLAKSGDVQQMLGISRQRFTKLSPHLFALVLGGSSQRFPLDYLLEYRDALQEESGRLGSESADTYARTGQAIGRIAMAQAYYQESLAARVEGDVVPVSAFLAITGLGRQTVWDWRNDGRLDMYAEGRGRHRQLFVPVAEIERITEWRLPQALLEGQAD